MIQTVCDHCGKPIPFGEQRDNTALLSVTIGGRSLARANLDACGPDHLRLATSSWLYEAMTDEADNAG